MADQKLSELTAATTLGDDDELLVNDSGTSKKFTVATAKTQIVTEAAVQTALGADPLDMDNMAEGADTKILTGDERTKLANIEALADVTDSTNVAAAGAVMASTFDANTILAADTDNTPAALTVAEGEIVGRASGGNIDGLTATQVRTILNVSDGAEANPDVVSQAEAEAGTATTERMWTAQRVKQAVAAHETGGSGGVSDSDFNANTILKADSDDTPIPLTVGEQTLVGRITAGSIAALTPAQVRTLVNVEDGADVTDATNVNSAGAVMESDYNAQTVMLAVTDNTPVATTIAEGELVGRSSGGNLDGLNASAVRTILNVADGADVTPSLASQAEAEAGTNNTVLMTPLRTQQQIEANEVSTDEHDILIGGSGGALETLATGATGRALLDDASAATARATIGADKKQICGSIGTPENATYTLILLSTEKLTVESATVLLESGEADVKFELESEDGNTNTDITGLTGWVDPTTRTSKTATAENVIFGSGTTSTKRRLNMVVSGTSTPGALHFQVELTPTD